MSFLYPLSSSSKGNCAYIGTKDLGILVDAGVGVREFVAHLNHLSLKPRAIGGIFITHEHGDHVKGLGKIKQALGGKVPIYGAKATLAVLLGKGILAPTDPLYAVDEQPIFVRDHLQITACPTPHDSQASVCYRVTLPDARTVAVCTDLGHVTPAVHRLLAKANLVLLESNYDPTLLKDGSYPDFLKRRIVGKRGHLSNQDCAKEVTLLHAEGVEKFVLGHLSQENNRPQLAEQSVVTALSAVSAKQGCDYQLFVAPVKNNGQIIHL